MRAKAVWFALLTFFIWGFEAPMAYYFGQQISHPILLLIVSYFFSTIAILISDILKAEGSDEDPICRGLFKTISNLPLKEKTLLHIAGVLRFLKDFVYYYVIYLYPEKIIHIIGLNYLWPVSLYLYEVLRNLVRKKSGHKGFTVTNITIFLVSILGAYFIISSTGYSLIDQPKFFLLSIASIVFGSGHSFIYGIYANGMKNGTKIKPTGTFSLAYRSLVALVMSIAVAFLLSVEVESNKILSIIVFGIAFSITQVLLAHGSYTKSIKIGDQDDFSAFTIYSMFFGIFISMVAFKVSAENEAVLGFLIVAYSVFFIRNKKSYLNALDKSLISLLIILFSYFHFNETLKYIDFVANLEVVSGMFSIIIGFSLSRLLDKAKRENELLTIMGMQVSKLLRYIQLNSSEGYYTEIATSCNGILRKITEFNFFPDFWSVERGKEIIKSLDEFEEEVVEKIVKDKGIDRTTVIEYLNEFETNVELWISERSMRLPRGERYASYILGFMSILGFAYSLAIEKDLTTQATDLSIIGFTFSVLYLLYSMTDLDLNRPDSSLRQIFYSQRLLLKQNFSNYIPRDLIERGSIEIYADNLEVECESDSKGTRSVLLSQTPSNSRKLKAITPYVILAVAIVSILFR